MPAASTFGRVVRGDCVVIGPVPGHALERVATRACVLQRMRAATGEGTDVVVAKRKTGPGADQTGWSRRKVLPPPLLGVEERDVVGTNAFVGENESTRNDARPQISNTGSQARLEVDV